MKFAYRQVKHAYRRVKSGLGRVKLPAAVKASYRDETIFQSRRKTEVCAGFFLLRVHFYRVNILQKLSAFCKKTLDIYPLRRYNKRVLFEPPV